MFRQNNTLFSLLLVFIVALSITGIAHALPPGTISVSPANVFQITSSGKKYLCATVNSKHQPVKKIKGEDDMYLPLKAEIKTLSSKIKVSSGSAKSKLEAKLSKLKVTLKNASAACKNGPSSGGNGSTPTPTPTPTSSNGACFESNGNATPAGKTKLGISSAFSANISIGKSIHQGLCLGCHTEKGTGYSMSKLRTETSRPDMAFSTQDITDAMLANLTAYLGRFSSNCN